METELQQRSKTLELLQQSEIYYDAQYGEAHIVAKVNIKMLATLSRVLKLFLLSPPDQ